MKLRFMLSQVKYFGVSLMDRQPIANYVASLRQLAHRLFAIVTPGTVIADPLLARNRHWNCQTVTAMVTILLFNGVQTPAP